MLAAMVGECHRALRRYADSVTSNERVSSLQPLEDFHFTDRLHPDLARDAGYTPLMLAVLFGSASGVRELVLGGADQSIRTKEGKTAKQLLLGYRKRGTGRAAILKEFTGEVEDEQYNVVVRGDAGWSYAALLPVMLGLLLAIFNQVGGEATSAQALQQEQQLQRRASRDVL